MRQETTRTEAGQAHQADTSSHTADFKGTTPNQQGQGGHRQLAALGVGLLVAITVVAVLATNTSAGSPPAFAVTEAEDTTTLEIVSTAVGAEQMTRELREQGIDVQVQTAAASPQLVGTWLSVGSDGGVEEAVLGPITSQALGHAVALDVPNSVTGLVLTVAIPPRAGEEDEMVVGYRNAFAPGGALACSPARGVNVESATLILEAEGFKVSFVAFPGLEPIATPASDHVVTMAHIKDHDPSNVLLTVLPPEDERTAAQLALGFAPSQLTDSGSC